MRFMNKFFIASVVLIASLVSTSAFADEYGHSTPGISGYDPVAYFIDGKPVRGSGYHVTVVDGVT